jgi:hypothetical protein
MQAIAFTPDLGQVAVVHQAIEKCRDRRRVAEDFGPILKRPI